MQDHKKIIENILKDSVPALENTDLSSFFEKPKDPEFGDIALPCFKLSGILRKSPVIIAQELTPVFSKDPNFESVTPVKGYLNFKFSRPAYIRSVCEPFINGSVYTGLKKEGEGKTMVIDFSSLNIAKEFHIGHLRSTIIGNSIDRIYRLLGWNTVRINHLGDWGTQFGKLIWAYKNWGDPEQFEKRPVRYLQELYVRFHKEESADPSLTEKAREWFARLENGDSEARELWDKFRKKTIEGIKETYDRIGIEFDLYRGEGYYENKSKEVIKTVEEHPAGKISDGALIIELEKYGMPPCLIRKSDGASIYSTRDIAAAIDRYEEFSFSKMIYVTELKQQLHFKQVFKCLEILGFEWIKNAEHVGFGTIMGISTRKGNVVYLKDIFDEARNRVLEIMKERDIDNEQKDILADKIGIGAVIFQDLSRSRIKNIEFDWNSVLSFEGETGPYIQYTFVRILHIIDKAGLSLSEEFDHSVLTDDVSYELIREIADFKKKVFSAYSDNEPSVIASYLIALSKRFNRFYRENRILGEDENVVKARGNLVLILENVFRKCMDILGIPLIDKM